ncbi:MAG TPA: hypothetical protein VMD25_06345 [Acidobacteriaceae bacterium]|nr:hypothetical protein [Acidobacteriaceae bacterium]
MKRFWVVFLLLPIALAAQNLIPPGTILPLRLDTGINAHKLRAGEEIRATVMQTIPGTPVRRGTKVLGLVIHVAPAQVILRFDTVVWHRRQIPIRTNLRALASMMEVNAAYTPEEQASRGLTPETWTTQQIGGDQVYRGGGPVTRGSIKVGEPTAYGVRGQLIGNGPCRGAVDGNENPQAFWLFSTDACGVYGIPGLTIAHAGRETGTIELLSGNGKLNIRSGSGMLLRVHGS